MTEFEEKLEALRARFVQRAAVDAEAIVERAAAGDWAAVRDVSHGLAGRAGMFGFAALSDAGLSPQGIAALSQVVAYVSYQLRLIATLRALGAAA